MKSILRTLLAKGVTFPITAGATFLATAITINYAGAIAYGGIALLANLFLLLPFADLGLGAAVINGISEAGTAAQRAVVIRNAMRMLALPAAAVALVGAAFSAAGWWGRLLGVDGVPAHTVDVVAGASLALFALSIPLSVGTRVLVGLGRNDVAVLISAIASVVALVLTFGLSRIGAPPGSLALAQVSGLLVANAVALAVALRANGTGIDLFRGLSGFRLDRGMLSVGLPAMILVIALPIVFQGQRVVVAHRSEPIGLAEYSLAMQFYTPVWSFISVAGTAMWPIFARQRAGSREALVRQIRRFSALFFAGGVVGATGLALISPGFADWISGGKIGVSTQLGLAAGLLLFAQALQQVPGMVLTDRKGLWFQAAQAGVLVCVVITVSWIWVPRFGPALPFLVLAAGVLLIQTIPGYVWAVRRRT